MSFLAPVNVKVIISVDWTDADDTSITNLGGYVCGYIGLFPPQEASSKIFAVR